MKLSKTKKIILSLVGIGILTISIVTPILIKNNGNNNLKNNDKKNDQLEEDISLSTATLKASIISSGSDGKIFQDEFKNLWSMGEGTKLQVLKVNESKDGYVNAGWTSGNSGLTQNSNITNGSGGTIFQDEFKNLWSMGRGSKLQVLKVNENENGYVNIGWINDNRISGDPLLKNSNITSGTGGKIFQDEFKNLWAMGNNSKIQVLKVNESKNGYVQEGWINDNSSSEDDLLKNSNITNGSDGKIFQDQFKNLWSMGTNKKLQVLKANSQKNGYVEGWVNDNSSSGDDLLKNSNITDGWDGAIFQDHFNNLWTMGYGSKLQVLKIKESKDGYVNAGWINNNDKNTGDNLLKGSNITSGNNGTIFQDEFKNLWVMGEGSKLQVLKVNESKDGYVEEGWINNNDKNTGDNLLKGSNITNGNNGTIFQDEFKNLWSMGSGSKLQVLKANSQKKGYLDSGWTDGDSGLTKGSKINKGQGGTIFQDKFKNFWSMGQGSKLQVLKANKNKDVYVYVDSWINK